MRLFETLRHRYAVLALFSCLVLCVHVVAGVLQAVATPTPLPPPAAPVPAPEVCRCCCCNTLFELAFALSTRARVHVACCAQPPADAGRAQAARSAAEVQAEAAAKVGSRFGWADVL
jgi:hypothetical protein